MFRFLFFHVLSIQLHFPFRSGEDLDDIGMKQMNSTTAGMDTSAGNSVNGIEAKPVALWNS